MSAHDLDEVTRQLEKTSVGSTGVSFEGKSLKLNTELDAKEVVEAINACQNLQYLNLEGNTLGVDAAKAIAKALEAHSEFKRALWKDLFTGRMKTEIPKALHFLGGGLVLAKASLSELDLSDNAFGPIGVEGLVSLLRSPSCYSLQILKLNNNGLGIGGGKMLSRGLLDCYNNSKEKGQPLALRVFVAGRNRLENEGAKALAEVFRTIGTLEEVCMPQNGIYHAGITALCEALTHNPNLQVLNLNDNTVTAKGAAAMANALPSLQNLRELNLGDCLLKTKGAILLADALSDAHEVLEEVYLECNEIGAKGGVALAKAMQNKENLTQLILGGNQFGEQGCLDIRTELKSNGLVDALGSLSDDEDEDEDEGEEDEEVESEDESESEESEEEVIEKELSVKTINNHQSTEKPVVISAVISVYDFLQSPTPEKFLALGSERSQMILREVTGHPEDLFVEKFMPTLMKVSSVSGSNLESARQTALSLSEVLYQELFKWAREKDKFSIVNNALLVHLGLIKSEDKNMKLSWNLDGCMVALERAIQQDYFPEGTRETLLVFLGSSCPDCVNTLWFMNRVRNMADSLDPFNINFWQYLKTTVKEQFGIQLYKIDVTFLPNFGNFAITWLLNLLTGDLGLQELRVRNAEWEEVPHAFSHMPSLKTLDISRNQITKLPPGTFDGVKNITLLNLAENYLTFIPEGISRLEHLKTLDLSRNPILITDLNMLSNLHRLQRLNLAHIPIKDLNILHKYFRSSNELLDLNLSDCNISLVEYDDLFNYTFKKSLQVLDLSGNGFTVLPPKLFSPLTNLKYLNLSNNKFTEDLCLDLNGLSLDILDISQNILTNPTSVIVSDRVENINISYNNISIWRNQNACRKSSSSSNTLWITHMNLSYNYISYISDEMAQLLETLTGAVELEGNILDCDNCQIIEFQKVLSHHLSVKFLEFDSENLTCSLPLTMRGFPILDMTFPENHPCLLKSAEKSSYSYVLASGITLTSLMVLAIVLAGFAYRYRYEISYMTHLVGIQCQTQKITYEYEEDQSLKYDAFVCYSAEDRMWVKSELVPHLESEPFHYQLCLHERDFSLGTIITNNIVSAMCTSRGNVVILTNAFIQSHWCRWELEMANKRLLDDEHHFLILLELDRLDRTTLPRHLKYLMDTRTYLEWPMQDSSKDAKNILWRRLTEALGDSLHCKRMALQNNKNK